MSGQMVSKIGAYDNASEFPASIPTFTHYLKSLNYSTCFPGKMHLVGPDQMHGFESRVTTDIHPSDLLGHQIGNKLMSGLINGIII